MATRRQRPSRPRPRPCMGVCAMPGASPPRLLRLLLLPLALLAAPSAAVQALAEGAEGIGRSESKRGFRGPRPGFLGALEGHRGAIYALAASRGGWLASGAKDKRVLVWNLSDVAAASASGERMKPFRRLPKHEAGVTALAFTEGGLLLSGSADNTTRIWDFRSGELRAVLRHPRTVFGVAVRPPPPPSPAAGEASAAGDAPAAREGREIATACWDGVVRLFGLPSFKPQGELRGHVGGLYSVAFSPLDGSLLASAGADRSVRIWDVAKMEMLWTIRAHGDHVTTVDWSPLEPMTLASGGWDRKFRLWEISSAEVVACRQPAGNCSQITVPRATGRHPQLVWKVAFAPGGRLAAACHGAVGQSPTVVIYEVASGRVVRRLGRHKDTPLTIAWAADGAILASAGMDNKVLLYEGHGTADDLPQGDVDTDEERAKWLQDLIEFRTGKTNQSNNVSGTNRSGHGSEAPGAQLPHPLAGRVALW
mmetsp:Transcript_117855/g.375723  ORF Transcript_117855/g.375723 Transcript_117855/m.375723 type:complete len:480 (-) Transcript_117855:221-1660(-)